MKRSLTRLLRVRELMEDLAQFDFERRSAEMAALEQAAGQQRRLAESTRAEAAENLIEEQPEAWLSKRTDAEILGWKRGRLEALAQAAQPVVNQKRQQLLERRTERRQVEMLQAEAARAEEKDRHRQEQNRTDDWFQSRAAREDRTRK